MKKKILNMIQFFIVLCCMILAIAIGVYAIVYSLIQAPLWIGMFIVGIAGLAGGLFTLNIVAEQLK